MKNSQLVGPYGGVSLKVMDRIADFGCNANWCHGFDDRYFESCAKHGIHCCVEHATFRADYKTRPDLLPIGVDGKPIRYDGMLQGICLSKTDYIQEIADRLKAGMEKYQPFGVWLDYLTYGGWFEDPKPDLQDNCFCTECVKAFCVSESIDADHPNEILEKHLDHWIAHKCKTIAGHAHDLAAIVKEKDKDCIVGAYMCPYFPDEYDGALTRIFGQDYTMMSPHVDVFTPLLFNNKSGKANCWQRDFLENCGDFVPKENKVQPIIDFLDFPANIDEMVKSSVKPWGFQVFNGYKIFEDNKSGSQFEKYVKNL